MNNKALTLSVVMAIMAVFFVQSYVESIEEAQKKRFGTEVMVVVAKKDIKEMDTIDETMLTRVTKPKRFLEPGAIFFSDEAKNEEDAIKNLRSLVGTIAVVPIKEGEQVTHTKISEPGIRTGLSPQITPGKRAFAVPVSETSGVAKLVKPGDRVDLIAIVDPGGGKDQKIARTVLQDVVVLAVGRRVTNNAARSVELDGYSGKEKIRSLAEDYSFSSVTIEVEPAQAQGLALLMANGESALALSLRNTDDTERFNLGPTTFSDLMGPAAQRMPANRR